MSAIVFSPSTLRDGLLDKGYSLYSANIITAQYFTHPNNRREWGREEQTRKDVQSIINDILNDAVAEFLEG